MPLARYFTVAYLLVAIASCGVADDSEFPSRPITLVCPWSAGGGTDRCSRQIAMHLETELNVPVNVINATGGRGVTGHSRGLRARADGYTITMITFELNTMHWSGLTNITHEDFELLVSINQDYAAIFVNNDAPWRSIAELENDIRENPGDLTCSGTAIGGTWHLALAGWLHSRDINVTDVNWISMNGAEPSLQELMSGGLDMVCCSIPEGGPILKSGHVRVLAVMAPKRLEGYEEIPTFTEHGISWSLAGWRGLAVPKGAPQEVVEKLTTALHRIVTGQTKVTNSIDVDGAETRREQTFPEFMQSQGFDHTWRNAADFRAMLEENEVKFGTLLTSEAMQSLNSDRFDRMGYPYALMALIGVTVVLLVVQRALLGRALPRGANSVLPSAYGVSNFVVIILGISVYALAAETVGFVMLVAVLLYFMMTWLGARPWISAAITVLFVPAVYHFFVYLLRVPLPQGVWGW